MSTPSKDKRKGNFHSNTYLAIAPKNSEQAQNGYIRGGICTFVMLKTDLYPFHTNFLIHWYFEKLSNFSQDGVVCGSLTLGPSFAVREVGTQQYQRSM